MSKIVQFPSQRQIETEACAWIAQLDGGAPTQQDLDAFREWIKRSPHHREEIKRLSALWGDLNILTELAIPLKKPKKLFGGDFMLRSAAFAAVAVAGIAVAMYFLRPQLAVNTAVESHFYLTSIGEQEPVRLADGSKILLNTDSRIQVNYGTERRDVHLLQGEAYFEVAHSRDKPFFVYAGSNIVRAVGTAFTVHIKKQDIEVIVTEGAVELSSVANLAEPKVIKLATIKAGQSATFNQEVESIQAIQAAEVTRKLSWREGVLSFSGDPLEKVVEEVSRYTSITIVISDPAIRNIAVGGYFKAGETDAMFEALETSFGVRVNHVNDRLVYLAAK